MSQSEVLCPYSSAPCVCRANERCPRDNRMVTMAPGQGHRIPITKPNGQPKSELVRRLEAESATRHVRDTKAELFSDLLEAIERHRGAPEGDMDVADEELWEAAVIARGQLNAAKKSVGL
jgi:hypothetical protein